MTAAAERLERLLGEVEGIQQELHRVEADASSVLASTSKNRDDAASLLAAASRNKDEAGHLVGRIHGIANRYVKLREEVMQLLDAHIPDEGAGA